MTLELTDKEHRAVVRLLRRSIDNDRFPLGPRHALDQGDPGQAGTAATKTGTSAAIAARLGTASRVKQAAAVRLDLLGGRAGPNGQGRCGK
jgi:hypothetical protein